LPTATTVEPTRTFTAEPDVTAVIYLRVSSPGQLTGHNPEGYSIDGQRKACEHYAASLGARIVREYIEPGRTATNIRREALQRLLSELDEVRPTYVIFYDLSRVARDEPDAFWLLGQVKSHGAKLTSTREPVDDSPQGLLLFAIMAGVNAFRSRDDGEKVKMGHERKFADGGTHGLARIGYLNVRENVEGREVASIAPDPERADYIKLAFELVKTGDHTITTVTEVLEEAGLRTRPTRARPSRPVPRSQVHRILRDDYYLGIITRGSVKRRGRHDALIDRETFDRVQEILSANRASGDRSHKHSHYLKGSIFCVCGKRLGYGRHRGKCGGIYEYFSCLSRVQRGERCTAPYFPVERTEQAIVRRYRHETLTPRQQADVRRDLRAYVEAKAEVARRESDRHTRRLRELIAQQQKLVQLYYNGGVSEEVLKAEQERITRESTQAQRWADAANREVDDVMQALDDALALLDDNHVLYESLNPICRRLTNQAIFLRLTIIDPDTIEAELTPLYDQIAQLVQGQDAKKPAQDGQKRPRNAKNKGKSPQNDRDPASRGQGSYNDNLAGTTGLEPATSDVTGRRSNQLSYVPALACRQPPRLLPRSPSMPRLRRHPSCRRSHAHSFPHSATPLLPADTASSTLPHGPHCPAARPPTALVAIHQTIGLASQPVFH
jgi:site-specific DNA recombinase